METEKAKKYLSASKSNKDLIENKIEQIEGYRKLQEQFLEVEGVVSSRQLDGKSKLPYRNLQNCIDEKDESIKLVKKHRIDLGKKYALEVLSERLNDDVGHLILDFVEGKNSNRKKTHLGKPPPSMH